MKLESGFSLIEVILAISLTTIVLMVASWFWHDIRQSYTFGMNQYSLTEKATQAGRRMANELRQAQEAMNGAYPLATLEDNQLAYYADADSDGLIEYIRYYIGSDETLKRASIVPSGNPPGYDQANEKTITMVDQINMDQLPLFTYYNGNWPGDIENNPLTYWERSLETRIIKIKIPVKIQQIRGSKEYATEFTVQIRNLKNNL